MKKKRLNEVNIKKTLTCSYYHQFVEIHFILLIFSNIIILGIE